MKNLTEDTILNLKMLSQIKPSDKIYLENDLIKIDTPYIFQGINRWYQNHNRETSAEDLDKIVDDVVKITDDLINKTDISNEENVLCQTLLIEINNASKGLSNLKITYKDDTFITSKLDIIKDKLKARKDKIISIMRITIIE